MIAAIALLALVATAQAVPAAPAQAAELQSFHHVLASSGGSKLINCLIDNAPRLLNLGFAVSGHYQELAAAAPMLFSQLLHCADAVDRGQCVMETIEALAASDDANETTKVLLEYLVETVRSIDACLA